ncbi:MAG: L-serine ammonia-lyase, iron-sulfur-dependent subunit beta [Lachnospiraceae bacterium]|nr:L-serine ammonia-lyase, iron-sulfur-dependent subunit beta [Lachnospiraceae bacterium]
MLISDIIGPVMVGPSSSHTAGAVRIGNIGRRLLGTNVARADIGLHGSFLATGRGHGTDRAIVAGLLGISVDDERIPMSFEIAREKGMDFEIHGVELGPDHHPNSARLILTGDQEKKIELVASSIGGGRIRVNEIDGIGVNFSGELPTLIVHNQDKPGYVAEVTSILEAESVNIATLQLNRSRRGGNAVMVIECDQAVSEESIRHLESLDGVLRVTYIAGE